MSTEIEKLWPQPLEVPVSLCWLCKGDDFQCLSSIPPASMGWTKDTALRRNCAYLATAIKLQPIPAPFKRLTHKSREGMKRPIYTLLVLMWVIHGGVEAVLPLHHSRLSQTQIQISSVWMGTRNYRASRDNSAPLSTLPNNIPVVVSPT